MKVILKEDVQNLGQQGDVVEVKAGYARNYLMPKRLAILFTEQQQKSIEEAQKVELRKLEREKDQIDSVLKDIKALSLSLKMKSEEDNKLFGSVTKLDIVNLLEENGVKIDKKYIDLAKDKQSEFRLMGFGHRVYKNYDPRAAVIKDKAKQVLDSLKIDDPLLDIARNLEEIALKDEYFVARKLYPNVDFYSGIIYRAMGIPTNMFTVMFALGRLPGWLAHWREMVLDGQRINRPRQVFTGSTKRSL